MQPPTLPAGPLQLCRPFVQYNVERWPLVLCTVQGVSPSEEVFEAHLAVFSYLLSLSTPFSMIFDVRKIGLVPLARLGRQARFMTEEKPRIVRNIICTAIVLNSGVVRGLINALWKLKRPSRPNRSFSTQQAAEAWIAEQNLGSEDVQR